MCLAWRQGNLHPQFGVLRVCCTQAYRAICLPWAAAWKIQRFLLFRKMTEYPLYNLSKRTSTCSRCMAEPSCLVYGVLCLQIIAGKKSLYILCSDSALMVASHKHMLKCSTLMRSTEPATLHHLNLQFNVIILSDRFLNPGRCPWHSVDIELCLIRKMRMGHRAASY